jgi:hypothetical protein
MSKKKVSKDQLKETTALKKIRNESLQGLELYLNFNGSMKIIYLAPREVVQVQEGAITSHVITLQKRRMVKVY